VYCIVLSVDLIKFAKYNRHKRLPIGKLLHRKKISSPNLDYGRAQEFRL
jgi:hypothetical protein